MAQTDPGAGSLLRHYHVLERLGGGGMGEVFLAEDQRLGRQVALKFISGADGDPEARARLVREAQAASALRSPHVAVTYDLVEDGDQIFIAMEYVQGELLSARLARGPLDVADALEIAMQVADALDEAHGRGIVHRDIKSANVMLTGRQLVKVLDFGLAKFVRPSEAERAATLGATTPGMVLGTLHYMAPEQMRGEEVDHRADLFSLGAVLYEMLTGRPPFAAPTLAESAERLLTQEPEAIARFNYAVPADVEAVARKALAKDAAFRYQSARELYLDLHHARERVVRDRPSGAAYTWRPGMHLPPVGFGQAAMPAAASREGSVAVLAFANLTGNPADDWVGQGMAESLTADFAKVRGLRSISREQIFDVQRGAGSTPARMEDDRQSIELGRRLGATWVVSGAVQRLGDRVRITARTIAVHEGRTVSSVKLDGTLAGIFDLQDRLVEELVRQGLQRELEQSEKRAIGADAHAPEAYEAYQRGMLNLRVATEDAVQDAIGLFERAIAIEPGYVDALVALGNALQMRGAFLSQPDALARSRALLEHARTLAPGRADVHVRLGQVLALQGDTDGAERRSAMASIWRPTAPSRTASWRACCGWGGPPSTTPSATSAPRRRWRRMPATPTCSWPCSKRSPAISAPPSGRRAPPWTCRPRRCRARRACSSSARTRAWDTSTTWPGGSTTPCASTGVSWPSCSMPSTRSAIGRSSRSSRSWRPPTCVSTTRRRRRSSRCRPRRRSTRAWPRAATIRTRGTTGRRWPPSRATSRGW
ncbi:MAG: protein kinase [Vicinamibacterales bacterium]